MNEPGLRKKFSGKCERLWRIEVDVDKITARAAKDDADVFFVSEVLRQLLFLEAK
jgi:hypothetical protein